MAVLGPGSNLAVKIAVCCRGMAYALLSIAAIGFLVWGYHMFVTWIATLPEGWTRFDARCSTRSASSAACRARIA